MDNFYVDVPICGYHYYMKRCWILTIGEQFETFPEEDNNSDRHAVAVTTLNSQEVVGHLPREISAVVWYFLKHKGMITGEMVGRTKRSRPAQGRLEILARLKLYHTKSEVVDKAKQLSCIVFSSMNSHLTLLCASVFAVPLPILLPIFRQNLPFVAHSHFSSINACILTPMN